MNVLLRRAPASVALACCLLAGFTAPARAGYVITTFDVPGALDTNLTGINNSGQMVGNYDGHGFILDGATFTSLDLPGSFPTVGGINNLGQIVGKFDDDSGSYGFVRTGSSYSTFEIPGWADHFSGINDAGQVVGTYWANGAHGFLWDGSSITTIDLADFSITMPGHTWATGINNSGQIVGSYGDGNGFLLDGSTVTLIDAPGVAESTYPLDINNVGQIVGRYEEHGFVLNGSVFTTIDVPGGWGTTVTGINDKGQIVGYYYDDSWNIRAFYATPTSAVVPEPATLLSALTGLGIVGLGYARRRRRSA